MFTTSSFTLSSPSSSTSSCSLSHVSSVWTCGAAMHEQSTLASVITDQELVHGSVRVPTCTTKRSGLSPLFGVSMRASRTSRVLARALPSLSCAVYMLQACVAVRYQIMNPLQARVHTQLSSARAFRKRTSHMQRQAGGNKNMAQRHDSVSPSQRMTTTSLSPAFARLADSRLRVLPVM